MTRNFKGRFKRMSTFAGLAAFATLSVSFGIQNAAFNRGPSSIGNGSSADLINPTDAAAKFAITLKDVSGHQIRCELEPETCVQFESTLLSLDWANSKLDKSVPILVNSGGETSVRCPNCVAVAADSGFDTLNDKFKIQHSPNDTQLDVMDSQSQLQCSPLENIACSGLFPMRNANETSVALLNGEKSLMVRLKTLALAKKSVRIQTYTFADDEVGHYVARMLKIKKMEGLDVRVIADPQCNSTHGIERLIFDLRQWYVEVNGPDKEYMSNTPSGINHRFHEKMWIIDGEDPDEGSAISGGMNISNPYFRIEDPGLGRWRDQDIWIKGKPVQDMTAAFERNWEYFQNIKKERKDVPNVDANWNLLRRIQAKLGYGMKMTFHDRPEIVNRIEALVNQGSITDFTTKPSKLRFFQNRVLLKESYIFQAYQSLINSAHDEILIENPYIYPTKHFVEALHAAVKRGVKIVIATNSLETQDTPALAYVSRYAYKDLTDVNDTEEAKRSGGHLSVYEWQGHKHGEGLMHSKFAIFDRKRAFIGSYNLDPRSENLNSENGVVIESDEVVKELADNFMSSDIGGSVIVTQDEIEAYHHPAGGMAKFRLWFLRSILGPML